jgi:hypothetical protein
MSQIEWQVLIDQASVSVLGHYFGEKEEKSSLAFQLFVYLPKVHNES